MLLLTYMILNNHVINRHGWKGEIQNAYQTLGIKIQNFKNIKSKIKMTKNSEGAIYNFIFKKRL